jgi:hypothetical protein
VFHCGADGSLALTLPAHAVLCSVLAAAVFSAPSAVSSWQQQSLSHHCSANANSHVCATLSRTLDNRLTLFLDTIESVAADVRHSTKAWPVFRKRARQLQIQAQQRLAKQAQLDAASNSSSSTTADNSNNSSTCSSRAPSLAAKLGFSTCVPAMRSAAAAAAAGAAASAAAAAAQSKPAWLKQRGCSKQAAERADFDNLWKQKASDALNSSSSISSVKQQRSTTPPLHAVYSRPHVRM